MLVGDMFEKSPKHSKSSISPQDIRQGMRVVARLIRHQGDQFWPLMERLKRELRELEDREKLLSELLDHSPENELIIPH